MDLKLDQIPLLAERFKSLKYDQNATRDIELLGEAFVWSDEKPDLSEPDNPLPVTRFFQYLLWYRKSLIQNQVFTPFTEFWNAFHTACPTWPGFRPERCAPTLHEELKSEIDLAMEKIEYKIEMCNRERDKRNGLL